MKFNVHIGTIFTQEDTCDPDNIFSIVVSNLEHFLLTLEHILLQIIDGNRMPEGIGSYKSGTCLDNILVYFDINKGLRIE